MGYFRFHRVALASMPRGIMDLMKTILAFALTLVNLPIGAQQTAPSPDAKDIFDRTKAATVIILSGEGAGRLQTVIRL